MKCTSRSEYRRRAWRGRDHLPAAPGRRPAPAVHPARRSPSGWGRVCSHRRHPGPRSRIRRWPRATRPPARSPSSPGTVAALRPWQSLRRDRLFHPAHRVKTQDVDHAANSVCTSGTRRRPDHRQQAPRSPRGPSQRLRPAPPRCSDRRPRLRRRPDGAAGVARRSVAAASGGAVGGRAPGSPPRSPSPAAARSASALKTLRRRSTCCSASASSSALNSSGLR